MEPGLPVWVRHDDGRLAPFDADAISQALFAASESLGEPNAFLARELTDGALHFLAREGLGETATTIQIAEVVEKVVRELGQPRLARAFVERATRTPTPKASDRPTLVLPFSPTDTPADLIHRCLEAFSLRAVYSPDLAAAHEEGLLRIGGLDHPDLLSAVSLEATIEGPGDSQETAWNMVAGGASRSGENLILDGAEWLVPKGKLDGIRKAIAGLSPDIKSRSLRIWKHLHSSAAPAWARQIPEGPLFPGTTPTPLGSSSLWLEYAGPGSDMKRTVWHWHGTIEENAGFLDWFLPSWGAVVFDRTRQPTSLGMGMCRRHPAVLLEVGVQLPALLGRPEIAGRGEVFLEKLSSLSRMAVSAGVQKRRFLRGRSEASRGFLLDRAVVRVVPLGLESVVRRLLGTRLTDSRLSLDLGRKILTALNQPLADEQRTTGLNLVLGGPPEPISWRGPDALKTFHALGELQRGLCDGFIHAILEAEPSTDRTRERAEWGAFFDVLHQKSNLTGIVWTPVTVAARQGEFFA